MDTTQSKLDLKTKSIQKDAKSNKYANKPAEGHAKKADAAPKRFIREFRNVDVDAYEVGQEVSVDTFVAGDVIDVTGVSKGKGFKVQLNATDNLVDLCHTVLISTEHQVL